MLLSLFLYLKHFKFSLILLQLYFSKLKNWIFFANCPIISCAFALKCKNHKPKQMINTLFFIALGLSTALLFFYWYANYSTKSGFATDENENNIPDSWEKYAIVFKLKNLIILLLGIVIGYLFSFTTF